MTSDDGRVGFAELQIGDARLMISDEYPEIDVLGPQSRGGTTVGLVINLESNSPMSIAGSSGRWRQGRVSPGLWLIRVSVCATGFFFAPMGIAGSFRRCWRRQSRPMSEALDKLKAICLALPEAVEDFEGVGSPAYKVRGKIFAMHHGMEGRTSMWCKAPAVFRR